MYCVAVFYFQDAIASCNVRRGCFDLTDEREEWKEKRWLQTINHLRDD